MVRKWSYLNNLNTSYLVANKPGLSSVYDFKVFKATTRFKYYNNSTNTRSVRKKYSRRKHRNNWVNMVYITRFWVNFFLKNKQFIRFYQSLGLVSTQTYSTTINLILKQTPNLSSDINFSTFSCSNRLLNSFVTGKPNWSLSPYLHNSVMVGMSIGTISDKNLLNDINPGLSLYDNSLYPFNLGTSGFGRDFSNLIDSIFEQNLSQIVVMYKINILLTLLISSKA